MIREVFPRWVKVNDQIKNVSDFSHLPPRARPKAFCPVCMTPVILKLGKVRVKHYAHKPEVVCAITQPETFLHYTTKYHIYNQLLSGNHLYVGQQCSNDCGESRNYLWVSDWGKVEIETDISNFTPDILLTGKDGIQKTIEIKVTHPVDDFKATFYKDNSIGWLEVEASESLFEGEKAWTIAQPLPFVVIKPRIDEWRCDSCQAEFRKEERARLKEQQKEEYKKHNYEDIIYAKMVDFYYPSKLKHRDVYYLKMVSDVNNVHQTSLSCY